MLNCSVYTFGKKEILSPPAQEFFFFPFCVFESYYEISAVFLSPNSPGSFLFPHRSFWRRLMIFIALLLAGFRSLPVVLKTQCRNVDGVSCTISFLGERFTPFRGFDFNRVGNPAAPRSHPDRVLLPVSPVAVLNESKPHHPVPQFLLIRLFHFESRSCISVQVCG